MLNTVQDQARMSAQDPARTSARRFKIRREHGTSRRPWESITRLLQGSSFIVSIEPLLCSRVGDNLLLLVSVTSFTSLVLLEHTSPPISSEPLVSSGTTIRILKLRRSLDAHNANSPAIKAFRRRTLLLCLPSARPEPGTSS